MLRTPAFKTRESFGAEAQYTDAAFFDGKTTTEDLKVEH
jgi:hypothetical protein